MGFSPCGMPGGPSFRNAKGWYRALRRAINSPPEKPCHLDRSDSLIVRAVERPLYLSWSLLPGTPSRVPHPRLSKEDRVVVSRVKTREKFCNHRFWRKEIYCISGCHQGMGIAQNTTSPGRAATRVLLQVFSGT